MGVGRAEYGGGGAEVEETEQQAKRQGWEGGLDPRRDKGMGRGEVFEYKQAGVSN